MAVEARTRVALLLPAPTTEAQYFLLDAILTELIQICGGVTFSPVFPPLFAGRWFDEYEGQTKEDANLLIFADAPVSADEPSLLEYLNGLKWTCQRDFNQDVVWVTLHAVQRVATYDP